MTRGLLFNSVTFQYDGQLEPVVSEMSFELPRGWTGVVGANGAGKSTILKLATGLLSPISGSIQNSGYGTYCPQRTDEAPPNLLEFLQALDGRSRSLHGRLQLGTDWAERWTTLSHGERKRAQIGVALWQSPALLAIDEPTNHLDGNARALLEKALASFTGVGLLVSHDRDLLDSLCERCLFVDAAATQLRPGGVSHGIAQARREQEFLLQQLGNAKRDRAKLDRTTQSYRAEASRADRKRSKRGLAAGDHDAREKINRARLTGKDGLAGKRLRQLDGRMKDLQHRSAEMADKVKRQRQMGISIPGARLRRNYLLQIPAAVLHYANDRAIHHPELTVAPEDRIGLVGPNGSGKSTLLRHLLDALGEDRGVVTYLPQEIDMDSSAEILNYARSLSGEILGAVMTVVSRLGSDPERLLHSQVPSPGEVRKLLLSLGIAQEFAFLFLDEPTNHLDLPSIECVEAALKECPCGLIVVSHDARFLANLTRIRWSLEEQEGVTELKVSTAVD